MIFSRTDILIPGSGIDMEKWSCIACDQHTSEKEYWENLEQFVGDAPSTLRMMLPEAYLERDSSAEAVKISEVMRSYLDGDVFRDISQSYIYVERELPSGVVRRGIVGALDLSAYDYAPDSCSPVRATEGTVEDRLPPRVAVRKIAAVEMPHVMVFINDPDCMLHGTCHDLAMIADSEIASQFPSAIIDGIEKVYDFNLNSGAGHIKGWRFSGMAADIIDAEFKSLEEDARERASDAHPPVIMAVGDGNHSLAAAKKCGDSHALIEAVNIHDSSIIFEPIHRVVFGTDTKAFRRQFRSKVRYLEQGARSYSETVQEADSFCSDYIGRYGGKIDYIHNDDTALRMAKEDGCFAVMLPALKKAELFDCVAENGPYPRKSFSIGTADEKRFYLECRRR